MGDGRTQTTLSFCLCPLTPDPTAFPQVSSLVYFSQHTCRSLWNIHGHDVSSINFINCFVLINNSKLSIYIVMGMAMLCAYIHTYIFAHSYTPTYVHIHACSHIHTQTYMQAHMYTQKYTYKHIYIEREIHKQHIRTHFYVYTRIGIHTQLGA